MAALPRIDEPSVRVAAEPAACWSALASHLEGSFGSRASAAAATVLGCEHVRATDVPFPQNGAVVPGFRVERAEPPQLLALAGRHRFSTYSLAFRLEGAGGGGTTILAETRAAFPGLAGGLYRATVISSGAHGRLMTSMLGSIRRRAERA